MTDECCICYVIPQSQNIYNMNNCSHWICQDCFKKLKKDARSTRKYFINCPLCRKKEYILKYPYKKKLRKNLINMVSETRWGDDEIIQIIESDIGFVIEEIYNELKRVYLKHYVEILLMIFLNIMTIKNDYKETVIFFYHIFSLLILSMGNYMLKNNIIEIATN